MCKVNSKEKAYDCHFKRVDLSSEINQSPTDHRGQFVKQKAHAKLQLKV
jgi:hypothetical protein